MAKPKKPKSRRAPSRRGPRTKTEREWASRERRERGEDKRYLTKWRKNSKRNILVKTNLREAGYGWESWTYKTFRGAKKRLQQNVTEQRVLSWWRIRVFAKGYLVYEYNSPARNASSTYQDFRNTETGRNLKGVNVVETDQRNFEALKNPKTIYTIYASTAREVGAATDRRLRAAVRKKSAAKTSPKRKSVSRKVGGRGVTKRRGVSRSSRKALKRSSSKTRR